MIYNFYRVGRVPIAIINYEKVNAFLYSTIICKGKGYVCVSNMRTVTLANEDDRYYQLMEHSLLNVPDGTPILWCARWWGIKKAERVCGPLLFESMINDKSSGLRHFFLGDTDETLTALTIKASKSAGAVVSGKYSPPFKPLEEYDLDEIANMINNSGANIVWTSLRAPKQDYLAQMLMPLLNDGIVVIGVGAAFRVYLGEYKTPVGILQKLGLAGFGMFRNTTFWTEFRWYVKHTYFLVKYFFIIKWRRLNGKKYNEL